MSGSTALIQESNIHFQVVITERLHCKRSIARKPVPAEMILGFRKMGPRGPPQFSEGATCDTEGYTFIFFCFILLLIYY